MHLGTAKGCQGSTRPKLGTTRHAPRYPLSSPVLAETAGVSPQGDLHSLQAPFTRTILFGSPLRQVPTLRVPGPIWWMWKLGPERGLPALHPILEEKEGAGQDMGGVSRLLSPEENVPESQWVMSPVSHSCPSCRRAGVWGPGEAGHYLVCVCVCPTGPRQQLAVLWPLCSPLHFRQYPSPCLRMPGQPGGGRELPMCLGALASQPAQQALTHGPQPPDGALGQGLVPTWRQCLKPVGPQPLLSPSHIRLHAFAGKRCRHGPGHLRSWGHSWEHRGLDGLPCCSCQGTKSIPESSCRGP